MRAGAPCSTGSGLPSASNATRARRALSPCRGSSSLGRELRHDRSDVEPCVLSRDHAVANIEDVQQPKAQDAAFTWDAERGSDRRRVHDRFIDDEVVAVVAMHRFEAVKAEVREELAIERGCFGFSVADAWSSDNVVLDIVGECRNDGLDVLREFRLKVIIDEVVEFCGVKNARHRGVL
jgi:hypothetical protein